MSVELQVRNHFHADARRFDAIYETDKTPVERFIDHVWRGVVRRRLDFTLEQFHPLRGKTAIDVGCGSGRFCLAYAQQGASHVLGIDFAPAMIDLANEYAVKLGIAGQCKFVTGSFPEDVPTGTFDYASANGFFDYVENPVPLIARMHEITTEKIVMSFPNANEWRVPLRRMRFKRIGCPLFLYTEAQVRKILADAGVTCYDWVPFDRDYMVVAYPSGR